MEEALHIFDYFSNESSGDGQSTTCPMLGLTQILQLWCHLGIAIPQVVSWLFLKAHLEGGAKPVTQCVYSHNSRLISVLRLVLPAMRECVLMDILWRILCVKFRVTSWRLTK